MAVVINVYGKADLKQIEKAEAQLRSMKGEVAGQQSTWKRFGSAITSTGAKIASGLAAAGLTRWLMSSKDAAMESETAQVRLAAAVRAAGGSWAKQGSEIDALIQKHSRLAAVDDEDLAGAFATLTQISGSTSKAMKYLGTVTDLSRGANIDMETAAKLVGKTLAGNTSSLSRYGIVLKKGATTQEAIAAIQKRYAGQAKAYGDSSAGAAARFDIALENLQETVGAALLPALEQGAKVLTRVLNGFQDLPGPVQKVVLGIGGVVTAAALLAPFANSIIAVAQAAKLASVATKLWSAAQWLFNAAMSANPIGIVIVAVAAFVAAIVIAWKKSETFRNVVIGAWNAIKNATLTVFNAITGFFKKWGVTILRVLIGPIGNLVLLIVRHWNRIRDGAASAFNSVVGFARRLPGRIASAVGSGAKLLYRFGQDVLRGVWNGMGSIAGWLKDRITGFFKDLLPGWAKKALGISSPSRVFATIGRQSAEGLAAGLLGAQALVAAAAGNLAAAAAAGVPPGQVSAGLLATAGAGGASVTIAPGAVVVNISGAGGSPSAITRAARAGIEPALEDLAREILHR